MKNYHYIYFHGILMYRKNYREHDMLVKFFTAEFGPKMFFLRGARKKNYKLAADILPFSYGKYTGNIKKDLLSYIISPIDVKHYLNISEDIYLNAYATYIMNLLDTAFEDGHHSLEWFNKLFYSLKLINVGMDPQIVTNIMELQLLSVFGVAPELRGCVICGRSDLDLDYSEKMGGLICSNHFNQDLYRLRLDKKTIYYLRKFSIIELSKINNIKVNNQTKKELRSFFDNIYENDLGIKLKSKKFLDQMNNFKI
ncbi:DNA repair protein RecO [Apilactobacillus sp. M161]|uniref:DNA repair protein RecO n=1 Tax=Apilactobacillus xinyiensis TaxID=2841032 RepID=A0ABT0HZQ3_9LACO|nr:DNA repair protein RecO [Apilactobacillus xinyiensis]MCK8624064.1 DNA repair protein RecO [Apilactobacillus xinyiensis]